MKNINEDFYIRMLRFGVNKMQKRDGFYLAEIVEHLSKDGEVWSVNSSSLVQYFPQAFFDPSDPTSLMINPHVFYSLKPDAYFQLLNYDTILQSKKDSKEAKYIAIISILLTFTSMLIAILKK